MTNGDRLNAMFRDLRRQRLVARQNFLCCGGCAAAAIGEAARERGLDGGVYYHKQDAERLRPSRSAWRSKPADSVFLGFGAVEGGPVTTVEVGHRVRDAAIRAGLDVEWDGTAEKRIEVRLPGGIDAEVGPTLAEIRAEAQRADDAFGAALRKEYGRTAGDARYWHDAMHPPALRAFAAAKVAADERVRRAIEEGAR